MPICPDKRSARQVGTSSFAASHISHAAGLQRHRSMRSLSPERPPERLLPQLDFLPTAARKGTAPGPPRARKQLPKTKVPAAWGSTAVGEDDPTSTPTPQGVEIVMPDDNTVSPQESRAEAPSAPPERHPARQLPVDPGVGLKQGGGGSPPAAVACAPRVEWSKDAAKGAMAGQVEEAPIVKVSPSSCLLRVQVLDKASGNRFFQ